MSYVRNETYYHSPQQLVDYVRDALAIADECLLSDSDRLALLPKLVELRSAKNITLEQVGPVGILSPNGPGR
jgi:hypothetical protein